MAYLKAKEDALPGPIPDVQQLLHVQREVLQKVNRALWEWVPKKLQDLPSVVLHEKKHEMQRIGFEELSQNPDITERTLRCRMSHRVSA